MTTDAFCPVCKEIVTFTLDGITWRDAQGHPLGLAKRKEREADMNDCHVLYPVESSDRGTFYRCGSCEREVVILPDGVKVILKNGVECTHEMIEPVEEVELYPEFADFFAKKGWA